MKFLPVVLCFAVDLVADGQIDRRDAERALNCVAAGNSECDFNKDGKVDYLDADVVFSLRGCKETCAFTPVGSSHGSMSVDAVWFKPQVGWMAEVFSLDDYNGSTCGPKVVGPNPVSWCYYTVYGCNSQGCTLCPLFPVY